MRNKRTRDLAIEGYIRLPQVIRKVTDPIIQNRAIPKGILEERAEKGKQQLKKLIIGKKRKRR